MRKLLFGLTVGLVLALTSSALADGLCSVTVTATCTTVTFAIHVPKGEGGSTAGTATADGITQDFVFEGTDATVTIADEGTGTVAWVADGDVTTEGKTKHFHFDGTVARSGEGCAVETTPPPSTTPPPVKPPTHTAPPLAFTGGPNPLPFAIAATVLGLVGLGLLRVSRWRRA